MVNVGKAQDGLLDFVNTMKARIDLALLEVDSYRISGGLTAREIEILNAVDKALQVKGESE